jgi:hypothetical protein
VTSRFVRWLSILAFPVVLSAQDSPRRDLLVLGTIHFANPGHDIANSELDDVLSATRQREIAQLVDVLKRFRPTKIAVESDVHSSRAAQQYAAYLAGTYTLTRNEIDQIGYRLARELGHKTVYAVDADGDFPYIRVQNYLKANGRANELAELEARSTADAKALQDFGSSHTLLDLLRRVNSGSSVARDMAWYSDIVRVGEPWEYAGPELLAGFFQRNIRIYHNIVALATAPDDRVLVIIGKGHLGWLRQDAENDPHLRLVTLDDLLSMH